MTDPIDALVELLHDTQPATVLTGAGISVTSGLPVYRDSKGNWIHSKPVQGPAFRADEKLRQRYWSRSYLGWQAFSKAKPNSVHTDLAAFEHNGVVSNVITQNVDGLHHAAGTQNTIALHGNLSEVICLGCEQITTRAILQERLQQANPDFQPLNVEAGPDGDALIADEHSQHFRTVGCSECNGVLKPHVVFFGDNVPRSRVDECMEKLLQTKLLICIGTSLMVFSGFRFCRTAHEHGIPIVLINDGVTRADDIATLKITGDCTEAISTLRKRLL